MELTLPETWKVCPVSKIVCGFYENNTGNGVLVPRKYYSTFVDKIKTKPYLLFKIISNNSEDGLGEQIVTLAGGHNETGNVIIVPNWMYMELFSSYDSSYVVEFNGSLLDIEPISTINCSLEMTNELNLDVRSAVEKTLNDYHIIYVGMPFVFTLDVWGISIDIQGRVISLSAKDYEILNGFVGQDSEVSVEFTFIKTSEPRPNTPMPTLENEIHNNSNNDSNINNITNINNNLQQNQVTNVCVTQEQLNTARQEKSREERQRLIRESWIRRTGVLKDEII